MMPTARRTPPKPLASPAKAKPSGISKTPTAMAETPFIPTPGPLEDTVLLRPLPATGARRGLWALWPFSALAKPAAPRTDMAARMRDVKDSVLHEMQHFGKPHGVPLKTSPFQDIVLPQPVKRRAKPLMPWAWGLVAAVLFLAFLMMLPNARHSAPRAPLAVATTPFEPESPAPPRAEVAPGDFVVAPQVRVEPLLPAPTVAAAAEVVVVDGVTASPADSARRALWLTPRFRNTSAAAVPAVRFRVVIRDFAGKELLRRDSLTVAGPVQPGATLEAPVRVTLARGTPERFVAVVPLAALKVDIQVLN